VQGREEEGLQPCDRGDRQEGQDARGFVVLSALFSFWLLARSVLTDSIFPLAFSPLRLAVCSCRPYNVEDAALGAGLLASPKDRAEHIMLVDLARNDVNRVCQPSTVQVDDLMRLEKFSHVIHLTSQISGMLREDKTRFARSFFFLSFSPYSSRVSFFLDQRRMLTLPVRPPPSFALCVFACSCQVRCVPVHLPCRNRLWRAQDQSYRARRRTRARTSRRLRRCRRSVRFRPGRARHLHRHPDHDLQGRRRLPASWYVSFSTRSQLFFPLFLPMRTLTVLLVLVRGFSRWRYRL
jgi:hypothetical protein